MPGEQHRQALAEDGLDPRRCPAQGQSGGPGRGEPVRVAGLDGTPESGEVLDRGELEVQSQLVSTDEVTQQRPRPGAAEFGEPVRGRLVHPFPQIRMRDQKGGRDAGAAADGSSAQAEGGDVVEVVGQHRIRVDHGRACGGHRRAPARLARAAPYSAASCSMDRYTYPAVVSGHTCPINSRSTIKSIPAEASSVP